RLLEGRARTGAKTKRTGCEWPANQTLKKERVRSRTVSMMTEGKTINELRRSAHLSDAARQSIHRSDLVKACLTVPMLHLPQQTNQPPGKATGIIIGVNPRPHGISPADLQRLSNHFRFGRQESNHVDRKSRFHGRSFGHCLWAGTNVGSLRRRGNAVWSEH